MGYRAWITGVLLFQNVGDDKEFRTQIGSGQALIQTQIKLLCAALQVHSVHAASPTAALASSKLHCWYADHAEVQLPPGHRFPMDKYRATRLALQAETALQRITEFYPSPPAPTGDLTRVHDAEYVDGFINGTLPSNVMKAIGFPWSPSIVTRNLASAGGTLAATHAVLKQPELRITAHVSGGTHHAFSHAGEGFCVFNDIAVSAALALAEYSVSRILVIDLDVHQGNGTAQIFATDTRVVTFDMYCDSNYPWRTRQPATYNVALPDDISDDGYLQLLREWLPRLQQHQPQLVFYQAGVDALAEDSLGKLRLSREALNTRNNLVLSFALQMGAPLVITMGGGYSKPTMDASVAAHADVYRTAAYRVAAFRT